MSLVEALVALAVMGIGMLGVAGMQATLRTNADNAKQRSEAVRIAQQYIEDWRAFAQLAPVAGLPDFDGDIVAGTFTETPVGSNTVYQGSTSVQPVLAAPARPAFKSLAVELQWPDRTGMTQSFMLASGIAGMPPALPAALGRPALGDPVRTPAGRDRAIPVDAVVEMGGGTSRFDPPGSPTDFWRFDNDTGLVIATCEIANPANCTLLNALVISGFVRYAYGASPPTSADAGQPQDQAIATGVGLSTGGSCVVDALPASLPPVPRRYLAYYCLVPLTVAAPTWSGKVVLSLPGQTIVSTRANADPTAFKVCRYTPAASHTPAGGNVEHPLQYTNLSRSLASKNFLVIAAGSGSPATSHDCPSGPPPVNTYWHQPE